MARFSLAPAAQRDLDGIFDYTLAHWGRDQALRYVDLIEAACAELAAAPHRAPACDHIRKGYRRRAIGRHVLYFRIVPDGIAVVRILHQRMNAPSKF
jgi:toxin ParE1/3/4